MSRLISSTFLTQRSFQIPKVVDITYGQGGPRGALLGINPAHGRCSASGSPG